MGRRCAGNFMNAMARAALGAGLSLAVAACTGERPSATNAEEDNPQARARAATPVSAPATPTATSAEEREHFREVLKSKFDVGRVVKWQHSPDGPVFVKPS